MKYTLFFYALIGCLYLTGCSKNENELKITEYIHPFIGTAGNGQCYPGAVRPFGGIFINPDYLKEDRGEEQLISSFSHTCVNGIQTGDFQDIRLLPVITCPDTIQLPADYIRSNYSLYSPENEQAEAGYYSVTFDNGIRTEVTVTDRCGIYYYQYPAGVPYALTLDLGTASSEEYTTGTSIRKINNRTIEGYRKSSGLMADQKVYFVIEFSQDCEIMAGDEKFLLLENGQKISGKKCYAWINFGKHTNKILAKISISSANAEGAAANLEKELSHWSFDKVRRDAKQSWKRELIKTRAEGANEKQLEIFYTALYHAYLSPTIFSDANGNYKGPDGEIHSVKKTVQYTSFPLQANYRTLYPLLMLTQKKRMPDIIQSMLKHYDTYGMLPVYEFAGNETRHTGGNPAISVLTEAYTKGIRHFDTLKVWQAMKKTVEIRRNGREEFRTMGYIPVETDASSLALSLEYAYEDWCMAQMAKAMGTEDDYLSYLQSSRQFSHLFHPELFRMQARTATGEWVTDTCGQALYSWAVPHDISGLISLYHGPKNFVYALDQIFCDSNFQNYPHQQVDFHHLPYLYAEAGRPDKTQYYVHAIRNNLYDNSPEGLCGKENIGQLSAWYVFSALGFYPVNPASGKYILGTPLFKKVTLKTGPEKRFVITANRENDEYIYVHETFLNGKKLERHWITHDEIMNGGKLEFVLSTTPKQNKISR